MSCDHCPICGSVESQPVLEAKGQPLLLNHLLPSEEAARMADRCDLAFRGCNACGFVRNAAFDSARIVYGPGYVNDQSGSPAFRAHLDQVAQNLRELLRGVPGVVVEVGCGQGTYLEELCRATGRRGIGFDPALDRSRVASATTVELRDACFDEHSLETFGEPIALIYCRHVLEHIPDPLGMIETMTLALRNSPAASLYVEVPSFDWIEEHGAFFDLFNEHCSLFGPTSMSHALFRAGFGAVDVREVFGGQYLAATARGSTSPSPTTAPTTAPTPARRFDAARQRLSLERSTWARRLDALIARGPTSIWGAAAKGVSIVNHLGLGSDAIACLIDINPSKQGRYVPLTGQRVIAPEEFAERARRDPHTTVLIMNPNYEREISRQLAALGCTPRVEVAHLESPACRSTPLEVQR